MGDLIQFVLPLVGIVVAITLLVALVQLFAIRKLLEVLVKQGRIPVPARFEEDSYQASAASRPLVVSTPPPPPVAVEQTRFEASPEIPLKEEAPDQVLPTEQAEEAPPASRLATVSPPPLIPTEPKTSRLPVVIGIVVLVLAIGFLAFLVLYTK